MMHKRKTIFFCLLISCISFSNLKGMMPLPLPVPDPVIINALISMMKNKDEDPIPWLTFIAHPDYLEIQNGYFEIKGPLLEHMKLHLDPEQCPNISAAINNINKVNNNAVALHATGNQFQLPTSKYKHGRSSFPHELSPNLNKFTAQQFAHYFRNYTNQEILNQRCFYKYPGFVEYAKTIPGYERTIEYIWDDIADMGKLDRLGEIPKGQYSIGLEKDFKKLYKEVQVTKKKRALEFDKQRQQRQLEQKKERELQLQQQRDLELQKQKDLELKREIEESQLEVQEEPALKDLEAQKEVESSSNSSQSADKKPKPAVQRTRIAKQIPVSKPPRNSTLPNYSLNIYDKSLLAELGDGWLSKKDTAYNQVRLEERLDALNKVKMGQGDLALDEQVLNEVTESRLLMHDLVHNFGHDHHVQIISPLVYHWADQAEKTTDPIVAFALSDVCDMATKALSYGMHVLYGNLGPIEKGVVKGVAHFATIEHMNDVAMSFVQMGKLCTDAIIVLGKLETAAELDHPVEITKMLEETLHSGETYQAIAARYDATAKSLQQLQSALEIMSWQEIIGNGAELGIEMIQTIRNIDIDTKIENVFETGTVMFLDGLLFHGFGRGLGKAASVAKSTIGEAVTAAKNIAKATEGQLIVEAAGGW